MNKRLLTPEERQTAIDNYEYRNLRREDTLLTAQRALTLKEVGEWLEERKGRTYYNNIEWVVSFNFTLPLKDAEAFKRGEMPGDNDGQ